MNSTTSLNIHDDSKTSGQSYGTPQGNTLPTECPRSMEEHRRLFWGKFSTFSTHHRHFKTCQENGTLDFLSAQSMGSILAEYSNIVKPKLDSPNPKDDQTIFCQTKVAYLHLMMWSCWNVIVEFFQVKLFRVESFPTERSIRAHFGDGTLMGAHSGDDTPRMRSKRHWEEATANFNTAYSKAIKHLPPTNLVRLDASYSLAVFVHWGVNKDLKKSYRILYDAFNPTQCDPLYPPTGSLEGFKRMEEESRRLLGLSKFPHLANLPDPRGNGEFVPQREYTGQGGRIEKSRRDRVKFLLPDGSYPRVSAAEGGDCPVDSLNVEQLLPNAGPTVKLRFEWPGYPSKFYTLCIPKFSSVKLARKVAKFVKKFIEDTKDVRIHPLYARWKVGPGNIEAEHLRIISIEQVTLGSCQVLLFLERTDQSTVPSTA